jgi:hypothetical protein
LIVAEKEGSTLRIKACIKDTGRAERGDTQTNLACKCHDTPPRFSKGVQRVEAFRAQASAIPRPRALRMPTKRPAQKDCRFKGVRCPPTAFPLPFASNGDVGTPRLEKQL